MLPSELKAKIDRLDNIRAEQDDIENELDVELKDRVFAFNKALKEIEQEELGRYGKYDIFTTCWDHSIYVFKYGTDFTIGPAEDSLGIECFNASFEHIDSDNDSFTWDINVPLDPKHDEEIKDSYRKRLAESFKLIYERNKEQRKEQAQRELAAAKKRITELEAIEENA